MTSSGWVNRSDVGASPSPQIIAWFAIISPPSGSPSKRPGRQDSTLMELQIRRCFARPGGADYFDRQRRRSEPRPRSGEASAAPVSLAPARPTADRAPNSPWYLHMISQVECLLEAAICEPLVQYFPVLLLSLFLTAHDQCVALLGKFDFVRSETGNGHADPIIVFADPLNVVRRPVGTTAVVQHVKEAIEAPRRAISASTPASNFAGNRLQETRRKFPSARRRARFLFASPSVISPRRRFWTSSYWPAVVCPAVHPTSASVGGQPIQPDQPA